MRFPRRTFLRLAAIASAMPVLPRIATALNYPTRPVHIVVGFPAGLGPDVTARLIAQQLSERSGQSFVVENRPGAGSNIATEAVVKSPSDGYTLLLMSATNAINATLYRNLTFDFVRDIAPVASVGTVPFLMLVNPSVPTKTVREFIAYAKARPGQINMGSAGIGTAPHVFGELFMMMTGVKLVHVPYNESYYPDLLAGRLQIAFAPVITAVGFARSGKLRALAVTSKTRLEALPDIPTVAETVPGYEASGWLGVGAPARTSTEIIDWLNANIDAVLTGAKAKSRLADIGVVILPMAPTDYRKFIAADVKKWASVIKFAGIKPV